MRELRNKVAVVTGAASGIGRALAERFAAEGMKVVLADIDEGRLAAAAAELRGRGAEALPVRTDVARAADLEALASETVRTFGGAHLVCNNAGVATPPAPAWEKPLADWELVLGVNLWGVIHGIRAFLPILLGQDTEAHVVNTASAAGLIRTPHGADYLASKHAVVSLSESILLELAAMGSKVKVSVLCPGYVRTRILEGVTERARGAGMRPDLGRQHEEAVRHIAEATEPAAIAEAVVQAVREERFYVLPHPELKPMIEARLREILSA